MITAKSIAALLPKREPESNKGTFGRVLVYAGSKEFLGAAFLSCAAAYRTGAGLVSIISEPEVQAYVITKIPEVTATPFEPLDEKINTFNAALVGPGLGTDQVTKDRLHNLLNHFSSKKILNGVVIDAEALNYIASSNRSLKESTTPLVLTPHPGEAARLLNTTAEVIQKDRKHAVTQLILQTNQIIVLKGANTIIGFPQDMEVNDCANPLLATAGTGDVLAGIIVGLIAQGVSANNAAIAGVYIHSQVAENLSEEFGKSGMVAEDMLAEIPKIIKNLRDQV